MFRICIFVALLLISCASGAQTLPAASPLAEAKRSLAAKEFERAKIMFVEILAAHPGDMQGLSGIADCELGLHQYQLAERDYRRIVAVQPQVWTAHKNLVIVEAALGRWEEFDRERLVLRAARERGAVGISAQDSDVIDTVEVRGQHWIVRDYFLPLGRSRTRYNFEHFSSDGRVQAYVSLESAGSVLKDLGGGALVVGPAPKSTPEMTGFALDFYDGKAHGTVATYATEPTYERLRSDFLHWQAQRAAN